MKITKLNTHKAGLRGFALTEVLLAIAVIVIIGIAAYPLYKNARTSSEVEAMANDIAIVQTNAQTLYSGQSSYAGITMDQLNTAGLVPDDLKTCTGTTTVTCTYNNSWGGVVSLVSSPSVQIPKDSGFTIGMTVVPQTACTQLVNRVAPSFLAIGTTAGAGDIKSPATPKVDLTALGTACGKTGGASLYFTAQ